MATAYSRTQISLHWVIFILIALQYILHEPMAQAWEAIEKGLSPEFHPLVAAHVGGGLLVLVLAIWRIKVRLSHGAPALPEKEPALMKLGAHVTHIALYALMILVPVSGAAAWFGGIEPAAEGHELLKTVLLVLIALHFLAAMFHQFVLKTNLMKRMK